MDSKKLQEQLREIRETIWLLANDCQEEHESLLSLLRVLEGLHREIRENLFEPSLPNTRKALYNLLRDMEETGGWPYIERMRLQDCLVRLQAASNKSPAESPPNDQ